MKLNQTECSALLIGCGSLGRWHAHSLLNSTLCLKVLYIYDRVDIAAENLYQLLTNQASSTEIVILSMLYPIPDVRYVVVATTATDRYIQLELIEKSLSGALVIIEKNIYNNKDDYSKHIEFKNNKYMLNLTLNYWTPIKKIVKQLSGKKLLKIHVHGKNWGLACNSVHFLGLHDLINIFSITKSNAYIESVYNSKRNGYIDFYGKLEFIAGDIALILEDCGGKGDAFILDFHTSNQLIRYDILKKSISYQNNMVVCDYENQSTLTAKQFVDLDNMDASLADSIFRYDLMASKILLDLLVDEYNSHMNTTLNNINIT